MSIFKIYMQTKRQKQKREQKKKKKKKKQYWRDSASIAELFYN